MMEALIKGLDPLAYAVILLSVRFVIHAWDTTEKKARPDAGGERNWLLVARCVGKLLLTGGLPALACVAKGISGLEGAGVLGEVMTGLSMAAVITGLHNLGKRVKPAEGVADPEPG